MKKDLIKPYGDRLNDGIIQLSFTLPVENSPKAKKAAEIYAAQLNLEKVSVVHAKKIGNNFTYFIVYARAKPILDYSTVKYVEVSTPEMNFYEINQLIKKKLHRHMVVVGATIGSDSHTVGIDAIMNMKGYNQNYGLERYPEITAINMGAQIASEVLIKTAVKAKADAILISQTVTQGEAHIENFTELLMLLKKKNLREDFILVAGGPKITHEFAIKLGYDAGFGPGTLPSVVASYLIFRVLEKKGYQNGDNNQITDEHP